MNEPKSGPTEPQPPVIPPPVLSAVHQPGRNDNPGPFNRLFQTKNITAAYGAICGMMAIGFIVRAVAILMDGSQDPYSFFGNWFMLGYLGTALAALSGGFLLSVFKPVPCPNCRSTQRAPLSLQDSYKPAGAWIRFEVQPREKCGDCGNIWQPPTPVWMLAVGIILSLVCIILFSGQRNTLHVAICGYVIILGCVIRLARNRKKYT